MKWRLGLASGACPRRPIAEVWQAIAESGAAGVELGTAPGHFDVCRQTEVSELAVRLRADGPRVVSIHAPFGGLLDLADPNLHHRHAAMSAVSAAARAVKRLGGDIVVVHPSDRLRDPARVQQELERSRDSLQVLAATCKLEGVRLALESPLPHLLGGSVDEFAWLLARLDTDVGVCLDTGHTALGHAWLAFVAATHDRLIHVHASDNHGHHDDHLPPGEGSLDWAAIRESLKAADYRGWIMLELRCPADDLASHFRKALQRAACLL